jgi:ADP-heptose:LPS heptosyltransferase
LADLLQSRGKPVVFTGAPGDRTALDAVAAALQTPMRRLDGATSLPVLAAIFSRARVVVSTDTGPMHIAAAVGTPVVALFGPTDPAYTGPYGAGHQVLRAGVPCSPCFKKECRTRVVEEHACMRRLAPEAVAVAVIEQWEGGAGQGEAAHRGLQPA